MQDYRCYFMNEGHIGLVEPISAFDDTQAIEHAKAAYEPKKVYYTGFELWDRDRMVHRFKNGQ